MKVYIVVRMYVIVLRSTRRALAPLKQPSLRCPKHFPATGTRCLVIRIDPFCRKSNPCLPGE